MTFALAACASSSSPSARSSGTPNASSPTAAAGRTISFTATDGVRLTGVLYGTGTTAVVLSNMGDNDPKLWDAFAPVLAHRGYLVLTYSYRYPRNASSFDSDMAAHTVDDLRGAVAQVRASGAKNVVLAGGSLGGMATAKVAASVKAAAMIVLSAPVDLTDYDFHVLPAELATTMPKLFIGSTSDPVVPFAETQRMFDLAAQPEELQSYDDTAHALHLFEGDNAKDLTERLLAFLAAKAPA
jgi:pimeloyl-ACP methyl ester carboxylesterase